MRADCLHRVDELIALNRGILSIAGMRHEIVERDDPDEPLLLIHDRQTPHPLLSHRFERRSDFVMEVTRVYVIRHHLSHANIRRARRPGCRRYTDITVGDHSDDAVLPVEDGYRATVIVPHDF